MEDHDGFGPGQPGPDDPPAARSAARVARPETGEPRVDAALALLDDLTEMPVAEHPEVFERVHARLGGVLDELNSAPPGGQDRPVGRDGG